MDNKTRIIIDMLSICPEIDSLEMGADTDHWYDVIWNPNINDGEFQIFNHEGDHIMYHSCKTASDVLELVSRPNEIHEVVNWDSIEEVSAVGIYSIFDDIRVWDHDIEYCNNVIRGYIKYIEGNEEMANDILEILHQRDLAEIDTEVILITIADYIGR